MSEPVHKPLDIDKAALFLIKKYGDESAVVAYNRANCCRCRGDEPTENEWLTVLKRVVDLHFAPRAGPLH